MMIIVAIWRGKIKSHDGATLPRKSVKSCLGSQRTCEPLMRGTSGVSRRDWFGERTGSEEARPLPTKQQDDRKILIL